MSRLRREQGTEGEVVSAAQGSGIADVIPAVSSLTFCSPICPFLLLLNHNDILASLFGDIHLDVDTLARTLCASTYSKTPKSRTSRRQRSRKHIRRPDHLIRHDEAELGVRCCDLLETTIVIWEGA